MEISSTINSALIISMVLDFLVGFAITVALLHYLAIKRQQRENTERNKATLRILADHVMTAYTEQHDEQLLLFDSVDNSFLCQALDMKTLAQKLYSDRKISTAIVKHSSVDHTQFILFKQGRVITDEDQLVEESLQ